MMKFNRKKILFIKNTLLKFKYLIIIFREHCEEYLFKLYQHFLKKCYNFYKKRLNEKKDENRKDPILL